MREGEKLGDESDSGMECSDMKERLDKLDSERSAKETGNVDMEPRGMIRKFI